MTLAVFPFLEGLEWDITKRADFKTAVFESLSGCESRIALRQYPKYTFKLSVGHLIENQDEQQLKALMGFMLSLRGSYSPFLYSDPTDNSVVNQWVGVGNDVATQYQLIRAYGATINYLAEPVQNITASPAITVDGVSTSVTSTTDGIITFSNPPASGKVIRWTGTFYYRCRFLQDGYDFTQLMKDLHECRDIDFVGSVRSMV